MARPHRAGRGIGMAGLAACLALALTGAARGEVRIAYVNSETILEQSKEAQNALAGFTRDVEGWNKEAQDRRKGLDDLTRELAQQAPMLSDERRRELEQDLQRKLTEYDQFIQSIWGPNGLVVKRNEEVLRPIVTKIQLELQTIGAEEGYDIVFDAADSNVLYADPALDLTARIIEKLNSDLETGQGN